MEEALKIILDDNLDAVEKINMLQDMGLDLEDIADLAISTL